MTVFDFMLVFATGTIAGWVLELFYRTFISQKMLVNPGFLSGPYLPIYGFGFVFLYFFSLPDISLGYRILLFFCGTTILELVTGEIFLRFFSMRLWDYSDRKFNYKGLVCPLFSIYWTILSLLFYYFIYPGLKELTVFAYENIYSYWFLGFYYGLFIEDVVVSFHLASRLQKLIREEVEEKRFKLKLKLKELSLDQKTIDFKLFKQQVRSRVKTMRGINVLMRYFNPFMNSINLDLRESISRYFEKIGKIGKRRKNSKG